MVSSFDDIHFVHAANLGTRRIDPSSIDLLGYRRLNSSLTSFSSMSTLKKAMGLIGHFLTGLVGPFYFNGEKMKIVENECNERIMIGIVI